MNRKAHDAVVKARTALLITQPFYGCLALHLELVEITNKDAICETMAVDGVRMYHWPDFVLKLSEAELTGVVAHEVTHCAYKHMTRRGNRDPELWNMAGDFVINADLKKAGFTLPGVPLAWKPNKPSKAKGYLFDPKFDGMSTEEVYERIIQTLPPPLSGGGSGNDNESDDDKGGTSSGGRPRIRDIGGCGAVIDAAGPGNKATADAVSREWEATVRQAISVARAANAGSVPGNLERLVKQLQEPKVSWRDLTRRFIDQSMKKDYSWARPNRRFVSGGLMLPGSIPDGLHHLVWVVDCSGSISDTMLKAYVSEIAGALDEGTADRLTVIYADTDVRKVDEFTQGDLVQCKTVGGGGTDFAASFEWIIKNAPDAACVIYLTDMMTNSFGRDPGIPTLWAAYCPKQYLNHYKPSFGEVIEVDTEG